MKGESVPPVGLVLLAGAAYVGVHCGRQVEPYGVTQLLRPALLGVQQPQPVLGLLARTLAVGKAGLVVEVEVERLVLSLPPLPS